MKLAYTRIKENAPVAAVFLFLCVLTLLMFVAHQRVQRDKIASHAAADARAFQWGMQNGINAYLHLSRELAGFVAASPSLTVRGFEAYVEKMSGLQENPGISYIGFVPAVPRDAIAGFEQQARREHDRFSAHGKGADPDYAYPYLYVYPYDARSIASRGLDFAALPERWEAMQKARDSGQSAVTRKHFYLQGPRTTPVIVLFTPVYDLSAPASTVAQRRAALRGFVFAMYPVDRMVEQVAGSDFRAHFDLEIFDGPYGAGNLLYDSDPRAHLVPGDRRFNRHRRELLAVGGRVWQLYLFPKQAYYEQYKDWAPTGILVAGLVISVALAALAGAWLRRHRARLLEDEKALHFDAVFEDHPSAVYLLDRERRFINANPQALRELKIARQDLIGKSIVDFIVPEQQAQSGARFDIALQGSPVSYQSAILDTEGTRSDLSVVMIPIKTQGEVGSVLGFAQNITAQKIREWELTESRHMLQRVINHIPQRVFWKDLALSYLGCNNAFAEDAGLARPEDIIGKNDFDLAWHANARQYRADDAQVLASGKARINYEERQERDDGTVSWLRTSKVPLTDIEGKTVALLGLYEDITARKQMEAQLREMAHYDGLTRLANRSFFYHHLEQAISKAKRHRRVLALLYFDVDRFKQVNDTYGHDAGDALLVEFAARISASVRQADVAARLGGDEFAVLLDDVPDRAAAERVAAKLLDAMRLPFQAGSLAVTVSTSIGLAFFEGGMSGDDLVQRADQAMYQAKRNGRDRYEIDPGPAPPPPSANRSRG